MKTLQELKNLGVRDLSVSNGQAVAVNPYTNPKLSDYEAWGDIEIWKSTHNSLPCAESVKEGTYEIGEFKEQEQFRDKKGKGPNTSWENRNDKNWDYILRLPTLFDTRTVLVLSEPVAENPKFTPEDVADIQKAFEERMEAEQMKPYLEKIDEIVEVAEKPEGESEAFSLSLIAKWKEHKKKLSENMDLYKRIENTRLYDLTFSNWNLLNLFIFDLEDILCRKGIDVDNIPSPPEAVESAEEIIRKEFNKAGFNIVEPFEDGFRVNIEVAIQAMEEYASLRVAQEKAELIEKLKDDVADIVHPFFRRGYLKSIEIIKNS